MWEMKKVVMTFISVFEILFSHLLGGSPENWHLDV
jgi:hypothetical protein